MARVSVGARASWGASREAASAVASPHPASKPADSRSRIPWGAPQANAVQMASRWGKSKEIALDVSVPWSPTQAALLRQTRGRWGISNAADKELLARFAPYVTAAAKGSKAPWSISLVADLQRLFMGSGGAVLVAVHLEHRAAWLVSESADQRTWAPWGMGRLADVGTVIVVEPGDPADPDTPRVPVLEFYYVFNTVTLQRASDGAEIPAENLQIRIDRDGPHWTWSASIPGYARALVKRNPDPVEVVATVNGVEVHLVVERYHRDRRASRTGVSDAVMVAGRSRSAWLSDPYAPVLVRGNSSALMAQQIAEAALSINGVPIGWSLDWRVPDWLIPSGVWSHRGTHMEAVARVVEAAGGYIQAHPSATTLIALPHYPTAPWDWAGVTPDLILPEDVVEVEGSELDDKPVRNVVYVEGQGSSGRRDRILRAGSAADLPAEQIVDPLATDILMTRARGLVALAASGPQERVTLRLPVLPETGLILPGTFIEYNAEGVTRRGLVRSFQAEWSSPELWQTVEIEVHE